MYLEQGIEDSFRPWKEFEQKTKSCQKYGEEKKCWCQTVRRLSLLAGCINLASDNRTIFKTQSNEESCLLYVCSALV